MLKAPFEPSTFTSELASAYDLAFAFDLARLYCSEVDSTDDGRKFQFGPSRNIGKCVRILDKDGVEQYLATIRFYKTTIADEAEI